MLPEEMQGKICSIVQLAAGDLFYFSISPVQCGSTTQLHAKVGRVDGLFIRAAPG